MKNISNQEIGKALLRYGFVFIFLWFGINQVLHTDMWTRMIPDWFTNLTGLSAYTGVMINAVFEIVLAFALTFNIYTPIVSVLLSLHLISIAAVLNFNAVGIRDIGLAISVLALTFLSWERK